jgi:DNA modification methylase
MRNKRSVWEINTAPYKEAHFATFPPELVQPMVLAGCPIGGTVIDPFAGSGTTLEVAKSLNRKSIGIELNPNYCELIKKRVSNVTLPMDFGEEPSMTEEAINYEAKLI